MGFEKDKHRNDVPILNYCAIYEGTLTNRGDTVRVAPIDCNNDSVLLITQNNELYGTGNFGDACTSDQSIKIPHFINCEILQVAIGKNFAVVLTRNRDAYKINNQIDSYEETMSVKSTHSANAVDQPVNESLKTDDLSLLSASIALKLTDNGHLTPSKSENGSENI